jgi:GH15 family glucan-1,4-alpha-glucosidase
MQISLPEQKPVDTFYSNLVYDLIARDHIGADYIQTVNKLHYHSFYLRDGADIAHSYDVTGYPEIARQTLEFFAKSQKPDGNFLSQPQQYDGWGEAVWGYSQHYRITHDKAFAEWALPQIGRAVEWLKQARAADPLHIVPASDVRDNEYVPGHLTGYNFLALSGLKLAIEMASETGHANLAQNWQAEYDDFHQAFFKVLEERAGANNGYIPPALDGQKGGYDWGNLLAVVPEPTLDPHDPRVTATLKATQAKYAEGIMTYANGEFLHHYSDDQEHHDGGDPRRSGTGFEGVLRAAASHQLNQRRIRVRYLPVGQSQL